MNFVARVQPLQHLERADLPSAAGRMQKIGLDPQNLHSSNDDFRSRHAPVPIPGDEKVAPQHLQIQLR